MFFPKAQNNLCLHFPFSPAIMVSEVRQVKGAIFMGNYAVPDEIRNMRPAGTTVKNIKGHYYVYEYTPTSIKLELPDGTIKWKSKTITGACIGQSQDHHFKWWFEIAPVRGRILAPAEGGVSKAWYWLPHDEVI